MTAGGERRGASGVGAARGPSTDVDRGQMTAAAVNAGQRVGGDHWWDPDRARHLEDRPRFCPGCGSSVDRDDTSLNVEYWEGERRVHRVLCGSCDWTADVVRIHRVVSHEPDE